jgi:hypothetical protein
LRRTVYNPQRSFGNETNQLFIDVDFLAWCGHLSGKGDSFDKTPVDIASLAARQYRVHVLSRNVVW